ncbi:MAG: hypothetical protein OEV08_07295 [Nitrospira sp.]|nr:hypothetical protein [Nitrospira sp.]
MARIRPYESQTSVQAPIPGRNAQGADFGGSGLAELGQGIQSAGASGQQVVRFLNEQKARQETTQAGLQLTEFSTEFTRAIDERERTRKPSDPALSEWVQGQLKVRLDQLRGPEGEGDRFETTSGIDTFKTHAAHLVQHFSGLAVKMDADYYGNAAVEQHRAFVDKEANFVQEHPAHFELKRMQLEAVVNDPNGIYGNIPEIAKSKMIRDGAERYAVSAVQGFIRQRPNLALEVLRDPNLSQSETYGYIAKYIPNEKMAPLIGHAKDEVMAQEVEARQRAAEQRRQLAELQKQTEGDLTAKYFLHLDNPGNPNFPTVTPTEVSRKMLPRGPDGVRELDGGTGRAIIGMIRTFDEAKTLKSDNSTYWKLFDRIVLPWGHPDKLTSMRDVYAEASKRKLTPSNVKQLKHDFDLAQSEDGENLLGVRKVFLDSMKSSVTHANPTLGKLDQEGDINFGRFTKLAMDEENRMMKENRSPHDLYNENSPDYLGHKIGPYRKTMQQSLKSISQGLKRAPTTTENGTVPSEKQYLPGETWQQYKDRTGFK